MGTSPKHTASPTGVSSVGLERESVLLVSFMWCSCASPPPERALLCSALLAATSSLLQTQFFSTSVQMPSGAVLQGHPGTQNAPGLLERAPILHCNSCWAAGDISFQKSPKQVPGVHPQCPSWVSIPGVHPRCPSQGAGSVTVLDAAGAEVSYRGHIPPQRASNPT